MLGFGKLKDAMTLFKALGFWHNIKREVNAMGEVKNLILSKTFWFNILSIAATVAGVLPEAWAVPVISVANIGLRIISGQPVTLWPKKD
jgi:hypothetical protein